MIDYVQYWSDKTEHSATQLVSWIGLGRSNSQSLRKYYDWRRRYGKVNEHNAWVPRDFWLEDWEKEAIVAFHDEHQLEGYRRLAYLMIDQDVVAVSPSSVYSVLRNAGALRRWNGVPPGPPSKKGRGFIQPTEPHQHWHVDISYLNVCGTFYYLCSVLDGYSRFLVHWEIREAMTGRDVEIVLQRGRERFPNAHPRIIRNSASSTTTARSSWPRTSRSLCGSVA